jgi:SAM-dependent methyltransferase
MNRDTEPYLQPYVQATQQHGAGFKSLLWASPRTQQARFDALLRVCDFRGRQVLDAGCGRADLLDYLLRLGIEVEHYTGLEAVAALAEVARRKQHPRALIIEADYVRQPHRLLAAADVIIFCGSLNTFDDKTFYDTLAMAYSAATEIVAFNFLSSPRLAGADWLSWHRPEEVVAFAQQLTPEVTMLNDYMDGDCTIAMRKNNRQ